MEKEYDYKTRNVICHRCETLHMGGYEYQCCVVDDLTFFCTKEFFLGLSSSMVFTALWSVYKGNMRISLEG